MSVSFSNRLLSVSVFLIIGAVPLFGQQLPSPAPDGEKERNEPYRQDKQVMHDPAWPPSVRFDKLFPGLQKNAVSMRILARILSDAGEEIWKDEYDKITIPGRPVMLKLVGANIAVVVQLTAYRPHGSNNWVLVAQGQIWSENHQGSISYETAIQTISIKHGEKVYYFPLGSTRTDGDCIEICIELNPYKQDIQPENADDNVPEKTTTKE